MSFLVANSHVIWSVVFLILLKHLHSGRWNSFRYSCTFCIVLIVMGLVFFVATLLLHARMSCRVVLKRMPLLVVIGLLDFFVILYALLMLFSCINRHGEREFWGENRKLDSRVQKEQLVGTVSMNSSLSSLVKENVKVSLTKRPHRCIGRVNTFAPGRLYVKIVDSENGSSLAESKMIDAKWSTNSLETFDFDIPCYMLCGRMNRQYIVKCELWFLPEDSVKGEKIAEAIVRTNGWF